MKALLILASSFSGSLILLKGLAVVIVVIQSMRRLPIRIISASRISLFLLPYIFLVIHCMVFLPPFKLVLFYLGYSILIFFLSIYGKLSARDLTMVCWFGFSLAILLYLLRLIDSPQLILSDVTGMRYNEFGMFWKARHYLAFFLGVLFSLYLSRGSSLSALLVLMLYFVLAAASSSKTLIITGCIVPLIYYFIKLGFVRRLIFFRIAIILFFFMLPFVQVVLYLLISLDSQSIENVTSAVSYRPYQAKLLFDSFIENPFFGKGLGHIDASIHRSDDIPWAAELVYMRMLRDLGLVGYFFLSILATAIIGGFSKMNKECREYIAPAMVGTLIILIVSLSNPIFENFDALILLVVPALIRNHLWFARSVL